MRLSIPVVTTAVALAVAGPAHAQDGTLNMGVWVTVNSSDVTDFERAAADHSAWHASQNDPWPWIVVSAMSGNVPEYVFITPGHEWADFDTPGVDMTADMAHWAESGGRYSMSETIRFWNDLPELGNPPEDPTAFPVAMVTEFTISPGGEGAVLLGAAKFKEATQGLGNYGWAQSVATDGPPTISLVVWYPSFAALATEGPDPEAVMTAAFGSTQFRQLSDAFNAAATVSSTRIWTLRLDLSHIPTQ